LLQGLEDVTVITVTLRIAIPRGVQLGAVDARLEAREKEVITHQVNHVHVCICTWLLRVLPVDAQPLMYAFVSRHANAGQTCLVVLLMTLEKKKCSSGGGDGAAMGTG
jgi:hypothetical protein